MRKTPTLFYPKKWVHSGMIVGVVGMCIFSGSILAQDKGNAVTYDNEGFAVNQPRTEGVPAARILPEKKQTEIEVNDVIQGTLASCFDYYTFGSIGVDLTQNLNTYQPGEPVMITGVIKNNNKYPVVGMDIRARLVKNIPSPKPMRAEHMILDEFNIADNITLDANGEFQVSYTHLLPLNAPKGQYQLYFYAVEQDRFNLSGLSFTNDIVASRIAFDVGGNNPDHVYLDQTGITVGGQPHDVMAFVTQHATKKSIPVEIPLTNPTSTEKYIKVTYDLYSWDSVLSTNKIQSKSEEILVSGKSSKNITYTIEPGILPIYYLQITAEPKDTSKDASISREKTISNIRFVVQDESKPRLNFIGVDTYPLTSSRETTLVTCFHNTNALADIRNTKIETIIYDINRGEIAKTVYNGKTVSEITAVVQKFTPKNDLSEFTVESKMTDDQGALIDTVIKKYTCKDINPTLCKSTPLVEATLTRSQQRAIPLAVAILALIGIVIVVLKRKK